MSTYYDKTRAKEQVALALISAGWDLFDYEGYRSAGIGDDYGTPPRWSGLAKNDDYPGALFVMMPTVAPGSECATYAPARGDDCAACDGTGWAMGALTYEDALKSPDAAHYQVKNKGFTVYRIGGSGLEKVIVNKDYYFEDGRPKCLECYGIGYKTRQAKTVLWVWPQFQKNPNRTLWHIERNGVILLSGAGAERLGQYATNGNAAAHEVVRSAERLLKNMKAAAPAVVSNEGAVQYSLSVEGGYTWVTLITRISKERYNEFRNHFNASWNNKRRATVIFREVSKEELDSFFGNTAQQNSDAREAAVLEEVRTEEPLPPPAVVALLPKEEQETVALKVRQAFEAVEELF